MKKILFVFLLFIFYGCAASNITSNIREGADLSVLQNMASKDDVKIETQSIYKGHTLYYCHRHTSLLKQLKEVRFYVITDKKNKIIYMSQYGIKKHDRDFLIDFVEGDLSRDKKQIELDIR